MTEPSTKARELKPCPFCGGEAESDFQFMGRSERTVWIIECVSCKASVGVHGTTAEAIAAWNRRAHPEGEVREALEETGIGEVPPEDWEPRDAFGDYQGYGDLVDDVDLSNNGDVHSHGFAEGWWALAWRIRRALRGPTTSPATEALEALRGLSRRVRDHIVACHRTTATGADPGEIVGQIQETKAELDRYHDEVVVPLLGQDGGG